MVASDRQTASDYEVGYKKPPKTSQFKPGDRGNPKGRPRGSQNTRTIIEKALTQKVAVRKGDKTVKLPAFQVMAETFVLKAAQGDHRAFSGVINLATKSGIWSAERGISGSGPAPQPTESTRSVRPSDIWIESLDDNRLSAGDKIELSKLVERIDNGGDVTALSGDDFILLKQIMNKGRGKTVGPQAGDDLDQAA